MTGVIVDTERAVLDPPWFQAMLVCSVLAEHPEVLTSACPETTPDRVHNLVDRILMHECTEDVLAWQQRVPPAQWHSRWDDARAAAKAFYPHIPGADAVPCLHALDNPADDARAAAVPQQPTRR